MKRTLLAASLGLSLAVAIVFVVAVAEPVRDWHDLDAVHKHVLQSINEMERARARNHYDLDGHGAKAEDLLRETERELQAGIDSIKNAK
jgi:hypothetical protein